MNPFLRGALALGMAMSGAFTAPAGSPPADSASILEALRKKHELPALAVVVIKDGKICDRTATGVRKLGDPARVTTNDVFHIGSCTKSMTATLAAILIEEGKLRWDTTLAEVFSEGKMDKRYEGVTLEQLLMHRGGCPSQPPGVAWTSRGATRACFGRRCRYKRTIQPRSALPVGYIVPSMISRVSRCCTSNEARVRRAC